MVRNFNKCINGKVLKRINFNQKVWYKSRIDQNATGLYLNKADKAIVEIKNLIINQKGVNLWKIKMKD